MRHSGAFPPLEVRCRPPQPEGMTRVTETFSISMPPEMAVQLELVRKEEHRTRSELIREALRAYFKNKVYRDPQ